MATLGFGPRSSASTVLKSATTGTFLPLEQERKLPSGQSKGDEFGFCGAVVIRESIASLVCFTAVGSFGLYMPLYQMSAE